MTLEVAQNWATAQATPQQIVANKSTTERRHVEAFFSHATSEQVRRTFKYSHDKIKPILIQASEIIAESDVKTKP